MKYKIPTEENMEEMKPDTEVKEETSVPEEGAAEATAEKPAKKPHGFVQFIWFIVMSLIAFALQMIIAQFGDDLLALCGVANEGEFIKVGLDSLTLAGFIAYLVANIVAKVISYILNRKKTFAAVNNLAFSFSVYVIMCVALIVAETFIAAPIQNFWIGIGVPESWAGMVTVITYSIPDFLIVFLMEKFVIMNNKLFAKKEEAAAADETAVAVDETAAVEVPVVADEAVAEEAPAAAAEEAPVEQAAEGTAAEEAQSEEAVEEVAEAVEEATPVEEVVTEEPLAETPQEEQAIAEAEAVEEQTPSDEAPAAIEEAPVEEVAAEEPVAEEAQEAVAEEAPVEEAAPAEEAGSQGSCAVQCDRAVRGSRHRQPQGQVRRHQGRPQPRQTVQVPAQGEQRTGAVRERELQDQAARQADRGVPQHDQQRHVHHRLREERHVPLQAVQG